MPYLRFKMSIVGDTTFAKISIDDIRKTVEEWYKESSSLLICSFKQEDFMFGSKLNNTVLESYQVDFMNPDYPRDVVLGFKYDKENPHKDVGSDMYRWNEKFVLENGYYYVLALK